MRPRVGQVAVSAVLAAVVLLVAGTAWLAAPEPTDPAARARAIETTLRCPTCQATSVADSPAMAARQMRQVVEQQLRDGRTDDEIRAYFADRYGPWILLDPGSGGAAAIVWLLPGAVLLGGALLLVRRGRRAPMAPSPEARQDVQPRRRAAELGLLATMLVALLAPIPSALGSRAAGTSSSGGAPGASPSIADLEAWVAANPSDAEALTQLGDALLASGNLAEASGRYQSALAADPTAAGPKLGLAAILVESGRADVAAPLIDSVLAGKGRDADALLMKVLADAQLYGPSDARTHVDASRFLAAAGPDDPRRTTVEAILAGDASGPPPTEYPGTGSSNP